MEPSRRTVIHNALVRLSDGDRSAFSVLMSELWPILLLLARRGLIHEQDAEDVAQEVFYKICARVSDFDRSRDGLSWVFAIASYEILTQRKRTQRRREDFTLPQTQHTNHAEDDILHRDLLAALSKALGELTEPERILLGVSEGATDVQGATLRKRKQRALERLKEIWRRLYDGF